MAEQLLTTTIQAPGFMGLNLQDSSVNLDNGFATKADNCIIDKFGRVGARKGWVPAHSTTTALDNNYIECIAELIALDGTSYILAAGNNKLFKISSGTLVELTYGGGGTAPSVTASNWQAAPLAGCLYFYQEGHDPLVFDPATSTTTYKRISEKTGYLGTVQQSNCVISAYGRTWSAGVATNKSIIQFSDLLAGHVLNTGTSGTLDISEIWPAGSDEIIALSAHNNFLIVFGRRQILLYANATDPFNLALADSITGVGCLARDSVVKTGSDVVFLSDTGVRSLMRTIQEKSSPMREVSLNVKDDLISDVSSELPKNIKAVYSDKDAFYLLSIPERNTVYCFDLRLILPNGAARTTTWSGITPRAFFYTRSKDLLLGQKNFIGKYENYLDNTATFRLEYYTNYFDFGSPAALKILKKIGTTFVGGQNANIIVKYGFDFSSNFQARTIILGSTSSAEYGVGEYGIAEYSAGVVFDNKKIQAGGTGNVLQIGIEVVINNFELSLQKLDCYVKAGRTR